MIKYEDIIKRIANIEKKKIKNEERIKLLSEENNTTAKALSESTASLEESGFCGCTVKVAPKSII